MQTPEPPCVPPPPAPPALLRRRCPLVAGALGLAAGIALAVSFPSLLRTGVLTPKVLIAAALALVVVVVTYLLVRRKVRLKTVALGFGVVLLLAVAVAAGRTHFRYRTADTMDIAVREYSHAEYPEDPASRSVHHGQYDGRKLVLVKKDATHFDFILEPAQPHVARVAFRDIDVSLMTPGLPDWAKDDGGLVRIALTDRQWNRQQVSFGGPGSAHVEITGGDGFERDNLHSAELAKNCLNAGLWEVLLFTKEGGDKALYYQGWFTFPLGHYKDVFEANTGLPYWKHWYYLEHWSDPAGTPVALDRLRRVTREREVPATFDRSERLIAAGEQVRKRRTTSAENVVTWGDFSDGQHTVRFASFIPPGRYSVQHPWKNEYARMDRFEKVILREIVSPATDKPLHELELHFSGTTQPGVARFFVSGFDLEKLPRLPVPEYPKGLYMPMGIGTPPFFQKYDDLEQGPPPKAPFFSVLLDGDGKWIDHHSFAIDGPVLHRDEKDPDVLHVYLLSYERHSLIAHVVVSVR